LTWTAQPAKPVRPNEASPKRNGTPPQAEADEELSRSPFRRRAAADARELVGQRQPSDRDAAGPSADDGPGGLGGPFTKGPCTGTGLLLATGGCAAHSLALALSRRGIARLLAGGG
jgi:hypothetical protein